jgi:hypothetical protein
MKEEHILKIGVNLKGKIYKVASVIKATDRGIYVSFPVAKNAQSTYGKVTNIKYSYHPTGKNHLQTKGVDCLMKFPVKPKFDDISGIISTEFGISFWDIKTINKNTPILDGTDSRHKYKHNFEIDGNKYKHLTLSFFLAKTGVRIDKLRNGFKEICIIPLDDIQLIVATRDKWSGKHQENRQLV